jgi:hypothetical protein
MQGTGSVSSIKAKAFEVHLTQDPLQTFQISITDLLVSTTIGCSGGDIFILLLHKT